MIEEDIDLKSQNGNKSLTVSISIKTKNFIKLC